MKKICTFLICFTIMLLCPLFISKAVEINPSSYYKITSHTTKNIFQDVTYDNIIGLTRTDRPVGWDQGNGGTQTIDTSKWYGQQINVITVPATNEAMVIPWSVQSGFNWNMIAVTDMAKDFEEKHPEYAVLGGINGDFYDWHNTKDFGQSGSGLEVVGGNMLRYRAGGWNGVGFVKDENTSKIVFIDGNKVSRTATPILTIFDEGGNEIKRVVLDKFNEHANNNETTAYFGRVVGDRGTNNYGEGTYINRRFEAPVLGDGDIFIIENAKRVIYQADDKSYYGYGQISTTDKNKGVPSTGFAVATKNPEIKDLLSVGTYVRVQYELTGEYAGVDNIMGGMMSLISNNVLPEYTSDSYLTNRAPRTIVGQKADGSFCLLTMDGRQKANKMFGTNQQEINAFLKDYGITDAVLLDGGGSSTFFIREGNEFVVKNSPSDTGDPDQPRNVGNCLLVVTKRADFKLTNTEIKDNSVEFTIDTSEVNPDKIKNITCTLNGETKNVVDNKVTFTGLTSDTNYDYLFAYDTANKTGIETMVAGVITSAKKTPEFGALKIDISGNKLIFTPEIVDPDEALDYFRVVLDGKRNPYLWEPIEVKKDLTGLTEIEFDIVIRYDLNNGKEKVETTKHVVYDLTNPTGSVDINPEVEQPDIPEQPSEDKKKGCKKDLSTLFISILSLGTLLVLFKKRNK